MSIIIETLNDAGELVTLTEPPPAPDVPPPAAPPPSEGAPPAAPAPAPEPPAAPPAEAPPAAPAPAPVTDPDDDETDSAEVPRGVQRRIDRLRKRLGDAERATVATHAQYERDTAQLRGQLEMLTRLAQGGEPAPPASVARDPRREDYATDEEWLDARVDFRTEQRFQERDRQARQQAEQAENLRALTTLQEQEAQLRTQHADYDAQIGSLGAKGMTTPVYQALMQHELGPHLAYYLAQHPADLHRLGPLTPLQVWRELSKMERHLEGNGTPPTATAPSVPSSAPAKPPPLTPVGSGGSGAPVARLDDPTISQREWEAEYVRQYGGFPSKRR